MIDFEALVRPSTPNSYLLCADTCRAAQPDGPPLSFEDAPELVRDVMKAVEPRLAFSVSDGGAIQGSYVAVTPVLRFKDDVDVLITSDGQGGTLVSVYSRSRVGYSDLGANRKRVTKLAEELTARLAERNINDGAG